MFIAIAYTFFGFKLTDIAPLVSPEQQWELGELTLYLIGIVYCINFLIMVVS